jgi:FKBP-type peptidyl-prolyl cis-trans isomerase
MSDRFRPARRLTAVLVTVAALAGCKPAADMAISEVRVKVVKEDRGHGKPAQVGDVVCIDYRVFTVEGEEIMWAQDFCYELGGGSVIAGLDEGVMGMKASGKRVIQCPPHKHWGREGYGDGKIPKKTTLLIHVKLTSIE